jgi:hypothetical protein
MRSIWDTIVVSCAVKAGKMCKKSRRRVNLGLLRLVRVHHFTSSVVTPWGYKRIWFPLNTQTSSCIIHRSLLTSFPRPKKKEREKRGKRKKGDSWDLENVVSPSLSSHGGTRLDPFWGHIGSPARPRELGAYGSGRAHGLSCARGPHVPCAHGGIPVDLCSFLWVGIQCTNRRGH